MASPSRKKSTNVRLDGRKIKTIQYAFQIMQRISPRLAANVAFNLSFRVRPFSRPKWEQEILDSADEHILLPWRDGNIPTWSWGSGSMVLLVHGWEGRGSQLGHFIGPLLEAGFRVATFDGPGHGTSTVSQPSLLAQAEALSQVANHYGVIYSVVAHSMGATALTFAAAKKKIKAENFILIAAPTDPSKFYEVLSQILRLKPKTTSLIIKRAERKFNLSISELYVPGYAASIEIPALIIHDQDDDDVPVERSIQLAKAWPHSILHLTQKLGHRRILKSKKIIERVIGFIQDGK